MVNFIDEVMGIPFKSHMQKDQKRLLNVVKKKIVLNTQ